MKLITWNIQWGRGVDGRVDLERIVRSARGLADFDVLCLQEVADNFPGLEGNDERDQFAELSRLLPGYTRFDAFALDLEGFDGRRRRFGNAIFTRYRVLSSRRHALPWPADAAKKTMPRAACEVTLQASMGPLRVMTTHLEYYSDAQRRAQALRLRNLHDEACGRAGVVAATDPSETSPVFDPTAQTTAALLCGDFNFPPENTAYDEIQQRLHGGGPRYVDAWARAHPHEPHAPTFRLHDKSYGESPYCCDFVFASEDIVGRVRSLDADVDLEASDHQPLVLDLDDR